MSTRSDAPGPPLDGPARVGAFVTAVTTEHFALQSAASTTVTEASSRASLYVLTLSSSLVAIGFAVNTDGFGPLVATILPVIVVLGIFTTVRLVDTGVQNLQLLSSIARIRAFYRTLADDAATYFPTREEDEAADAFASMALTRRPTTALFTIASMVSLVNSVVAGAGATLLVVQWASIAVALVVGATLAIAFTTAFYLYQSHRYRLFHEGR
jgi:hypothetical protein